MICSVGRSPGALSLSTISACAASPAARDVMDETAVLAADRHIGEDLSFAFIYRPLFINNIVVRVSAATFRTGQGLADVLGLEHRERLYSTRLQLTLAY